MSTMLSTYPIALFLVPVTALVEAQSVVFHPLHRWVLSCLIIPGSYVYESGFGWERHGG